MFIPPYNLGYAVTPSDSVNFANGPCEALYVGGTGGTVVAVLPGGAAITFSGAVAGAMYPVKAIRVNNTSTTATGIVALYTV